MPSKASSTSSCSFSSLGSRAPGKSLLYSSANLGRILFGAVLVIIKRDPRARTNTTTPAPQTVIVLMKTTVTSHPNRPPAAANASTP